MPIAIKSLPACTKPWNECRPGDLCTKPRTCCQCESVHAAVPVVPETPLELKRLLPVPSGLCAIGSEVPTTVSKLAFPRTPLPSQSVEASVVTTTREATKPRGTPRLKRSGLRHSARASMQPQVTAILKCPKVHAVQGTRDFSHICSGRMCNKPR